MNVIPCVRCRQKVFLRSIYRGEFSIEPHGVSHSKCLQAFIRKVKKLKNEENLCIHGTNIEICKKCKKLSLQAEKPKKEKPERKKIRYCSTHKSIWVTGSGWCLRTFWESEKPKDEDLERCQAEYFYENEIMGLRKAS